MKGTNLEDKKDNDTNADPSEVAFREYFCEASGSGQLAENRSENEGKHC